MTYTALLLYVQHTGRYLRGSAAFEFSCFCSVSACISVICFTYYQSLPVGFESSLLRRMFGKSNAAADGRVFDFTLLWSWLVLSVTGITVAPIVHDYWRRQIDDSIAGMLVYLDDPSTRQQGVVALLQISDKASILAQQLDKAVESVRIVVLVYMAHAVLFLCILVPVAFKLISLLNGQIHSLVGSGRCARGARCAHYSLPNSANKPKNSLSSAAAWTSPSRRWTRPAARLPAILRTPSTASRYQPSRSSTSTTPRASPVTTALRRFL